MRYAIKITDKATGKATIAFQFPSRKQAVDFCIKANATYSDRVSEVYDREKQG